MASLVATLGFLVIPATRAKAAQTAPIVEVFMSAILLMFPPGAGKCAGAKNWTRDYTEKGHRVAAMPRIAHNLRSVADTSFQ